jgi:hypothetical protein
MKCQVTIRHPQTYCTRLQQEVYFIITDNAELEPTGSQLNRNDAILEKWV